MKKHKSKISLNILFPMLILAAITGFTTPSSAVFAWQQGVDYAKHVSLPVQNKIYVKQATEVSLKLPTSQVDSVAQNIQLQHVISTQVGQGALNLSYNTFNASSLFGSYLSTGITTTTTNKNSQKLTLSQVSNSSFLIAFNSPVTNNFEPYYLNGSGQEPLPIISSNSKHSQNKLTEKDIMAFAKNGTGNNILNPSNNLLADNFSGSLILRC